MQLGVIPSPWRVKSAYGMVWYGVEVCVEAGSMLRSSSSLDKYWIWDDHSTVVKISSEGRGVVDEEI